MVMRSVLGRTNIKPVPHNVDAGKGKAPVVGMAWQGNPDDLIRLAHDVAHALQIILSNYATILLFVRETFGVNYSRPGAIKLMHRLGFDWYR